MRGTARSEKSPAGRTEKAILARPQRTTQELWRKEKRGSRETKGNEGRSFHVKTLLARGDREEILGGSENWAANPVWFGWER